MIHLGDIKKINGAEIPVVDIVTGGSPCQDLSVAGKRAGLNGDRSGLFMEQIRIVKEMRERDRRTGRTDWLVRPRWLVWENVLGAFSSNGGSDFQAVLSEIVKIAEPDAPDVPMPKGGRWSKAGCLYSDMGKWSIAWRVHDAQFWGTPQRRKRIALVADFGGLAAPEVLFERQGLSWDSGKSEAAWESTSAAAEDGAGTPSGVYALEGNGARPSHRGGGFSNSGVSFTLNSVEKHSVAVCDESKAFSLDPYHSNSMKSANPNSGFHETDVARTLDCFDQNPNKSQGGICIVQPSWQESENYMLKVRTGVEVDKHGKKAGKGALAQKELAFTLSATQDQTLVSVYEQHSQDSRYNPLGEVSETVSAKYGTGGNNTPLVVLTNEDSL